MSKEKEAILYNLENRRIKVLPDGTIIGVWGKSLKYQQKSHNHCYIGLSLPNNTQTNVYVHRLIYWYFTRDIRIWDENYHIHHKDNNPLNNCISNLEIIERSEHGYIHNLGNKNAAKLNKSIVDDIRKLRDTGKYTQRYLSKKYNISETQIHRIVNRIDWK